MNLQVGLVADSPVWIDLLRQEGVPFVHVDLVENTVEEKCSLLIVNRPLSATEREVVEAYLRKGGAVFGFAQHLLHVADASTIHEQLEYLVSDDDAAYPWIHLLDLGLVGAIPREANSFRTQADRFAVMAGAFGGGYAVVIPFDVESALSDVRSASKCFYYSRDRLPAERVSLVSKGEIRQLVHHALEYLHHVRGLPYCHLWYFPYGKRNLFAFRVDTDGAPQREIDELYDVARAHLISMSWFLDAKSHEPWLRRFAGMANQEIGAHCYEHRSFQTFQDSLKDMTKAVKAIEAVGIRPEGFAAPYGAWNQEIGRAIDQLGFTYSSEFACAYDTLPLYPSTLAMRYKTLQVPIHPICIGSMMRVGYSPAHMKEYYHRVIAEKLSRSEPLFFYHHPTHRHWDVVEFIIESIQQQGIDNISMGEYARWWKKRLGKRFSIAFDGEALRLGGEVAVSDEIADVSLRISNHKGEEAVMSFGDLIDLKTIQWKPASPPVPPPRDIRRIRDFDPRALLGELHNRFTRKL